MVVLLLLRLGIYATDGSIIENISNIKLHTQQQNWWIVDGGGWGDEEEKAKQISTSFRSCNFIRPWEVVILGEISSKTIIIIMIIININNITECEYWVPRERKRRDHNVFYIATKKCCALTMGHPSIHPVCSLSSVRPSIHAATYLVAGQIPRRSSLEMRDSTKYNPMPIVSRPLLRLRPLIPRRTRKMDAHDSRIISYRSSDGDCEVCKRHSQASSKERRWSNINTIIILLRMGSLENKSAFISTPLPRQLFFSWRYTLQFWWRCHQVEWSASVPIWIRFRWHDTRRRLDNNNMIMLII